jgi:hypothetical protein
MDFKKFKESYFYRSGLVRYDIVKHTCTTPYIGHPVWISNSPIYSTTPMSAPSSKNVDITEYTILPHNQIAVMHLLDAIRLNLTDPIENTNWLSSDFRKLIKSQWIEISDICESIVSKNKKESNNFKMIRSALIITGPGTKVNPHRHNCPQVLTLCYKLSQRDNDMEPSHLKIGDNLTHKINFPDEDKLVFSIKNDPLHEVSSSEWRFWWINDFSDYFDIPENLSFHYWNDPSLDNKNLN